MSNTIAFNPTTPVRFYAKQTVYVPGEGQTTVWVFAGLLYAEWRSAFGDRVTAAQAVGVSDLATVRTFYHPAIYDALQKRSAIIVRNNDETAIVDGVPDKTNVNTYELWGGVDNVAQGNQYMEMQVRRYEGK